MAPAGLLAQLVSWKVPTPSATVFSKHFLSSNPLTASSHQPTPPAATVAVEVHYREYRTRISDLGDTLLMVSRRSSFTTRVLQAVMSLAAFGSAWYGAAEVVEIN